MAEWDDETGNWIFGKRVADGLAGAAGVSAAYTDSPRSIFKARELKTVDGSVWCVEAEWADGTIEEIGEFTSASEAWDWIAHHSREWFDERTRAAR